MNKHPLLADRDSGSEFHYFLSGCSGMLKNGLWLVLGIILVKTPWIPSSKSGFSAHTCSVAPSCWTRCHILGYTKSYMPQVCPSKVSLPLLNWVFAITSYLSIMCSPNNSDKSIDKNRLPDQHAQRNPFQGGQ